MHDTEMKKCAHQIGLLSLVAIILFMCTGCVVHDSYTREYPWSPKYHDRAQYHYLYYPSVSVYFDIDRNVYFYHEGGKWKRGASYPYGLQPRNGGYVNLDMDTAKPYKWHSEVEKRYPRRDYRSDHHEGKESEKDRWGDERSRDRN